MAKVKFFHRITLKDGRDVIVHSGHPAFLATVQLLPDGSIDLKPVYWLEPPPKDALKSAAIMRRLGDWYASEIR